MNLDDVLCFSHLRWSFVYQRPNHLMSRCARDHRVFFIEEPVFDASTARLECEAVLPRLLRIVPHLPMNDPAPESSVHHLLQGLCQEYRVQPALHWYYTPMMLGVAEGLPRALTVYDCMDELANFRFAPPLLRSREEQLLREADVVFTGGHALYAAKRDRHPNVHAMPSSVDYEHFARAREPLPEPSDQLAIAHPRLGYCGVIDERIDLGLVDEVAARCPSWHWIMLGPVVKIDPASLPRRSNIHYLGLKTYGELPHYLCGWDVATMPFACNEATRYISPTKTPEYLAAGKPVVSTPIADVIEPYGRRALVHIAADAPAFVAAVQAAIAPPRPETERRRDRWLAATSWDLTWQAMRDVLSSAWTARLTSDRAVPRSSSARV
jgi:UDP-galactopyranose mutase